MCECVVLCVSETCNDDPQFLFTKNFCTFTYRASISRPPLPLSSGVQREFLESTLETCDELQKNLSGVENIIKSSGIDAEELVNEAKANAKDVIIYYART